MTALATLDDLKSNGIEVTDEQTATSLLDSVSDAVRSAAGCPITLGEWTVDIPGEQSRKLDLPCKAVRSVSRVLIDGKTVYDWRLLGSSLYREEPWSPFGRIPSVVTVTFTGGWNPIPADVVRLVCSYVAAGLHQLEDGGPGAHVGVSYERVDDAQVGYTQGDSTQIDVTELPEATKRRLRNRFGANVRRLECSDENQRIIPRQGPPRRGKPHDRPLHGDPTRRIHYGSGHGTAEHRHGAGVPGKCKVQTSGGLASEQAEGSAAQAMGAVSLVWSLYVHFPYDTNGLRAGDVVEITESANPLLTGRQAQATSPRNPRRRTPPPAAGT